MRTGNKRLISKRAEPIKRWSVRNVRSFFQNQLSSSFSIVVMIGEKKLAKIAAPDPFTHGSSSKSSSRAGSAGQIEL